MMAHPVFIFHKWFKLLLNDQFFADFEIPGLDFQEINTLVQ